MTDAPLLAVATRLKNCSAYLGNDSGITHLAAMLGVPTLALFGPSNPNVWRPVGTHVQVLYNSKLESIRVETVLDILTTIVNEKYKNG
jgi:ADP-heptose:LPS heptosyltransferase